MKMNGGRSRLATAPITSILILLSLCSTSSQQVMNAGSKRGLAYPGPPSHPDDYVLFFSANSSIRWYYNWSPNPSRVPSNADLHPLEFLPMVHGTSNLDNDLRSIRRLSVTNQNPDNQRKVLSFNEPDGAVANGGSDISPRDAASAYIKYLLPLRNPPYNMAISHPSVTGTGNGLDWLREFNASCHDLRPVGAAADEDDNINRTPGCPTDFLSVHHYGDLPALASWIGTLNGFYNADLSLRPDLPMYITEFALVQTPAAAAEAMLNSTMPYLDNLTYVAGYAWFGLFRTTEPNDWTGPGNALIDSNGGLSALGSAYLGGSARGFSPGASGSLDMFKSNWDWGDGTTNENGGFANPGNGGRNGNSGSGSGSSTGGDSAANSLTSLLYGIGGEEDTRTWGLVAVFVSLWALFWLVL